MIAVSRKRTYRDESSVDTAVAKTNSSTTISGKSSQVHCGVTPKARRKIEHDDQVDAEVEETRNHHRQRDHQAGELRLSDDPLLVHDRQDGGPVASEKNPKRTTFEQQQHRIVRHAGAEPKIFVKTKSRTANRSSGRSSDQTYPRTVPKYVVLNSVTEIR